MAPSRHGKITPDLKKVFISLFSFSSNCLSGTFWQTLTGRQPHQLRGHSLVFATVGGWRKCTCTSVRHIWDYSRGQAFIPDRKFLQLEKVAHVKSTPNGVVCGVRGSAMRTPHRARA